MITKYRDVSGNYLNYIPLLRPFSTAAELLGFSKGEKLMADVGKRRYGYHAALQQNLRREIELGVDKPWCVPRSHFPLSYKPPTNNPPASKAMSSKIQKVRASPKANSSASASA